MSSLSIMTNMMAINTNRSLKNSSKKSEKASEKLSSGYRINRSADDAAGLSISEKMRGQIRGLDMAQKNVEDGMGLINTMDGGMQEIADILKRQRELTIQGMNDTNTDDDRNKIQLELDQLTNEISAIANGTEFNTRNLLNRVSQDELYQMPGYPQNNILHRASLNMPDPSLVPDPNHWEDFLYPTATKVTENGTEIKTIEDFASFCTEWVEGDYINFDWDFKFNVQPLPPSDITPDLEYSSVLDINGNPVQDRPGYSFPNLYIYPDIKLDAPNGQGSLELKWDHSTGMYNVDSTLAQGFDITINGSKIDTSVSPISPIPASVNGPGDFKICINGSFLNVGDNSDLTANGGLNNHTLDDYFGRDINGNPVPWKINIDNSNTHGNSYTITENEHWRFDGYETYQPSNNPIFVDINGNDLPDGTTYDDPLTWRPKAEIWIPATPVYDRTADYHDVSLKKINSDLDVLKQIYAKDPLYIQAGANTSQSLSVDCYDVRACALGLVDLWGDPIITTYPHDKADKSLNIIDNAIGRINGYRAQEGAQYNRLEHAGSNLGVYSENLTNAESRIRDTDMAKEMIEYTTANILSQAGMAMLTQANQIPKQVLTLLT